MLPFFNHDSTWMIALHKWKMKYFFKCTLWLIVLPPGENVTFRNPIFHRNNSTSWRLNVCRRRQITSVDTFSRPKNLPFPFQLMVWPFGYTKKYYSLGIDCRPSLSKPWMGVGQTFCPPSFVSFCWVDDSDFNWNLLPSTIPLVLRAILNERGGNKNCDSFEYSFMVIKTMSNLTSELIAPITRWHQLNRGH